MAARARYLQALYSIAIPASSRLLRDYEFGRLGRDELNLSGGLSNYGGGGNYSILYYGTHTNDWLGPVHSAPCRCIDSQREDNK